MKKLKKRDANELVDFTLEAYTCCFSCPCIGKDAVNDNADYGFKDNTK